MNQNNQQKENLIDDPLSSVLSIAEEKYSNLKILDQKPIIYKDSPFESRKDPRRNISNENQPLFKTQSLSQKEENSEYSEEKSENLNKNKRINEMINYISGPGPVDKYDNKNNVNKNYQKMRTQQNPTVRYKNYDKITQQPKINIIDNNNPEEDIIYNNQNEINYTRVPKTPQVSQNIVNQDYPNQNKNAAYAPVSVTRVQHGVIDRQKDTNNKTEPRNEKSKKHHNHKTRKIKVEIIKTDPKDYNRKRENDIKHFNDGHGNNDFIGKVSFSNKNIDTNNIYNNYNNYNEKNSDYDNN